MFLNTILKNMSYENYDIMNEQEIECLALAASELDKKVCIFLDNEKFANDIKSNVAMVLTTQEMKEKISCKYSGGLCIVENPRTLFFQIHNFLKNDKKYIRKKFKTSIGKDCNIHPLSSISDHNVMIGDHVIIEEFVSIKEDVCIGDRSIIRAGCIIGGEGFQFPVTQEGILAVQHCGGVVIGNNVEIQQVCNVSKALFPWDNTVIGDGTKLDALVHIGHAGKIGRNCRIPAGAAISGSVYIDDGAWIGVNATISNRIRIGKNARISLGSVVTKNVEENKVVTGNFAIDHDQFIENIKKIRGKEIN